MSTIVVEDGSGVSNANSYVSVAAADDYHSLRNNPEWAGLDPVVKTASLIYATDYIDSNFSWPGTIKSTLQALGWPRYDAFDDDGRQLLNVPQRLANAVCELALVHAVVEAINVTFERGGMIQSEQVGPVRVEYFQSASAGSTFPFLSQMLATLTLTGGSSIVRIVRS